MSTHRRAPDAVVQLVRKIMRDHHADLAAAGVTVTTLFAHAERNENTGEPRGSAITHGGYQAAGVIKITSQKDRAAGLADAVMTLDGDQWDDWGEDRQAALVDHELTHLEVVLDKEYGEIKLDDCRRPRLRIKLHDFQIGGFLEVIARHRDAAFEARSYKDVQRKFTQEYLPFMLPAQGEEEECADWCAPPDEPQDLPATAAVA